MGLFDFVKEAGEKLFRSQDAEAASTAVDRAPDDEAAAARLSELNRSAGDAIEAYVNTQGLPVTGLTVTFDGASGTATVFGVAGDQASKEKILLCCGNVTGVSRVNDMMSVDQSEPEAMFYTVVAGDNLSRIAKLHYENANKYMLIFEANRPMLGHPDKIYPGQVLRIPPL
ncbi:MAG TPA: peptidoglycan-binding protein LysM [Accumulibacter sp.]|uniref:peptidoglycan-binding protein LysM n=1 Tax=Accumulibacter sp. TaxID=2053492 RepID=UPI000EBC06FB|nr:peptidoglycan-binding protein LysM [Accumulibacter sp.]HCZ13739.1 peptidoglycan-binding protein LysM [Accumulibacter sp.]HRD94273.1 peptidoglycan-binding protein LysM [Accumulibacter sp.]HRF71367.1 peptidoglycan-binding protein LysM [Accumulibacter sp.]